MRDATYLKIQTFPLQPDVPQMQFDRLTSDQQRGVWLALAAAALNDNRASEQWLAVLTGDEQSMIGAVIDRQGDDLREHYRPLLVVGLRSIIADLDNRQRTRDATEAPRALRVVLCLLADACASFTVADWYDACYDSARSLYHALGYSANDATAWIEAAALCVLQED